MDIPIFRLICSLNFGTLHRVGGTKKYPCFPRVNLLPSPLSKLSQF